MTTKSKGESVRQKLTTLTKKMGAKYKEIETVFMIERLVARLIADKKLANRLVFKGGFVGLKVYESPRYTVDLDALLVKSNIDETLELVKQQAETQNGNGFPDFFFRIILCIQVFTMIACQTVVTPASSEEDKRADDVRMVFSKEEIAASCIKLGSIQTTGRGWHKAHPKVQALRQFPNANILLSAGSKRVGGMITGEGSELLYEAFKCDQ